MLEDSTNMANNISKKLEKAVIERNLEEVKALLSAGVSVKLQVDKDENSLLHHTFSIEVAKELLLHGADANARNSCGETPVFAAIKLGKELELVRELFKHGADANARNSCGETPVFAAIRLGNGLEVVRELLKHGADVNARKADGDTPLCIASRLPKGPELVRELLEHGADVNAKNWYGGSPLCIALEHDNGLEVVRELLKHHANVNVRSVTGETPLTLAIKLGKGLEVVRELLKCGADIDGKNWRNETPLCVATRRGKGPELVRELLKHGANVNAMYLCETPLCTAVAFGKGLELIRELLKHGANVNAKNLYSETPLCIAVTRGKGLELIRELLKHGADVVNERNREGNSVLYIAVKKNSCIVWHNNTSHLEYGPLHCQKLLIKFALIKNIEDSKKIEHLISHTFHFSCPIYIELSNYLSDCVCEILQMETVKIKNRLSLYEFIVSRHIQCNNQLSLLLAKLYYSENYPIYNDVILYKIKPFLERAELLSKLSNLQIYAKSCMLNQDVEGKQVILDSYSKCSVSEYLSNDDLLSFIVAFDDSVKHDTQSLMSLHLLELDKRLNEPSMSNNAKRVRFC